jgi:hypothetical protein
VRLAVLWFNYCQGSVIIVGYVGTLHNAVYCCIIQHRLYFPVQVGYTSSSVPKGGVTRSVTTSSEKVDDKEKEKDKEGSVPPPSSTGKWDPEKIETCLRDMAKVTKKEGTDIM